MKRSGQELVIVDNMPISTRASTRDRIVRAAMGLLADGPGPNGIRVTAFLDSGDLVLLSGRGKVLGSYSYSPG